MCALGNTVRLPPALISAPALTLANTAWATTGPATAFAVPTMPDAPAKFVMADAAKLPLASIAAAAMRTGVAAAVTPEAAEMSVRAIANTLGKAMISAVACRPKLGPKCWRAAPCRMQAHTTLASALTVRVASTVSSAVPYRMNAP